MSDVLVIMKKKFRCYWMKHLYQSRSQYGCDELLDILSIDESTGYFNNFAHMSMNDFENLIIMIGPRI